MLNMCVCALPSLFHLTDIPEMIVVRVIALEVGMVEVFGTEGDSVETKIEADSVMTGMVNIILLLLFFVLKFFILTVIKKFFFIIVVLLPHTKGVFCLIGFTKNLETYYSFLLNLKLAKSIEI